MATHAAQQPRIEIDSPLPLYRMDVGLYKRLAEAGALEGLDVELLDVAVSWHEQDRETKAIAYAGAPIPIYWLVDVPARRIEVRTEPGARGYERCDVYGVGERVPSPAEGVPELDVAQLFADAAR